MLDRLKRLNPGLNMFPCVSPEFTSYGRILEGYDFSRETEYVKKFPLPAAGVIYERSLPEIETLPAKARVEAEVFKGIPIQAGLCAGHNGRMNAMEWHGSSEVLVAATDLLLFLGKCADLRDGAWDSGRAEAFFVPEGTVLELYRTTLHFAPLHARPEGFRALIILPLMTNAPLEGPPGGDALLFAREKWLIAHPESPSAGNGAHPGITGRNIELKI